jgi:ParB/RepB/Spo0J family partition protein
MPDQIANIPVDLLVPPFVLLRLVDRESLDYIEMRDSISSHGFFDSICVRVSQRHPGKYEIIDGLYRFCCALDCGLKEVPCIIKTATDAEVKNWQLQANIIRRETATSEYAARLKMLFCENPELTMADLAVELHCRPAKLQDILRLNRLIPEAKKYLDQGTLAITTAYALAKVPKRLQEDLLAQALSLNAREFVQVCNGYIKAYKEAANQGKYKRYLVNDGIVSPYLRSFRQIKTEYENLMAGKIILEELQVNTLLDIWKAALAWVLHLDHLSVQAAKEKAEKYAELEQRKVNRRRLNKVDDSSNRAKAKKLGLKPEDTDMIDTVL